MKNRIPENSSSEKRTGLARVLSKMGYCSRSEAEKLVRAGRVQLNGAVPLDPETPVFMSQDRVAVDGVILQSAEKVYWVVHKPAGLVTTADDERGRETVYTLLPEGTPWMGPVGRLDMASEGLLLMTNDTEWAARITAPESHVEKTYHVQIGRAADDALLAKLEAGVMDAGDLLRAKRVTLLRDGDKKGWLEIILEEGRNRQIRRMLEACGIETLRLIRVAIGELALGDLPEGKARLLTKAERRQLDRS